MTHAAVYLRTLDRGAVLETLRFFCGERDELWIAPSPASSLRSDDDAPLPDLETPAATWIRERLAQDRRTKDRLSCLVIDGNGSMFAWTDVPEGIDAAAAVRSIERVGGLADDPTGSESEPVSPLAAAPEFELPGALTLEAFSAADERTSHRRIGVSATPDLATKLLLDKLDAMGVETTRVLTIWQAMALAWDSASSSTSSPAADPESQAIIDADRPAPTTATVVVDAPGRRLLWTWSRAGTPLASGCALLARDGSVPAHVISRISTEWLGWASQLGASPARIKVIQPAPEPQRDHADPSGKAAPRPAAMLAQRWPDCTTDAIELDDPVLATIARASDRVEGSVDPLNNAQTMASLSSRPGRLDRSARTWIGAAMLAAALGLGAASWQLLQGAQEADRLSGEARQLWREKAINLDDRSMEPGVLDPILFLEDELAARRREIAPVARRRPVMRELESVALVIGFDGVRLDELTFNQVTAVVKVRVDSTQDYEDLQLALSGIAGSDIRDWRVGRQEVSDEIRATFTGQWAREGP